MAVMNFDIEQLNEAKTIAQGLFDGQRNSNYAFHVTGYVSEDFITEDKNLDTRRTPIPEWLAGLAVATGKETSPDEVAILSFQLGKIIGRKGFVEVLN